MQSLTDLKIANPTIEQIQNAQKVEEFLDDVSDLEQGFLDESEAYRKENPKEMARLDFLIDKYCGSLI